MIFTVHSWQNKLEQWLDPIFFNPSTVIATKEAQEKILKTQDKLEIDKFSHELTFGTGGLRAIMDVGPNRLNIYTVRKVAQALANYMGSKKSVVKPKVVIGFDTRNNSMSFAHQMAQVFYANDIECLAFENFVTTPVLSFAITELSASIGVMITASHNPKEYNGIKVYNRTGGQVVPPEDEEIINCYQKISTWGEVKFKDQNITIVPDWVIKKYANLVLQSVDSNTCKDVSYVYTPLHGTGSEIVEKINSELAGPKLIKVNEQWAADGNFTHCESLNPENKKAFSLAVPLMLEQNADVAMATDPDSDRIAVVINHQKKACFLSGNQLAAVLCYYVLEKHKDDLKNYYIVKTHVTTNLIKKLANKYGVNLHETLTGFKWIGHLMQSKQKSNPSLKLLFAGEESCGYLFHEKCQDKDGIHSLFQVLECIGYFKKKKKTLVDVLNDLYLLYGYHAEELINFDLCPISGINKIAKLPQEFSNGFNFKIQDEDFGHMIDYNKKNNTGLPVSAVYAFHYTNDLNIYVRPSGTEPKIKVYVLCSGSMPQTERINKAVSAVKEWYLKF